MSVQVKDRVKVERAPVHRVSLPIGLNKFELLAAALTVAAVIGVMWYYFFSFRPIQSKVDQARARLAAQQKVITQAKAAPTKVDSGKQDIELAKTSLGDFEDHALRPIIGGRIEVINLLNAMVKEDKLRLGSGLDMHLGRKIQVTADTTGGNAQSGGAGSRNGDSRDNDQRTGESSGDDSRAGSSSRGKKTDVLDVFPRVQFRFTVFGRYEDIRKFLKDLQNTKDFLVIDTIGLADAEPKFGRGARGAGNGGAAAGMPGGIDLSATVTAYFRPDRPASVTQ
jgi:hypothetical protein